MMCLFNLLPTLSFIYMYIRQLVPKYREESEQDKGGVTTLNTTNYVSWEFSQMKLSADRRQLH